MDLEPGTRIERYVVEARMGGGTLSTTYRVRHATLDTLHVLTVPNVNHASLLRLLEGGARVQARLRHQNLVSVTDVLELDGKPAIVGDYVEGPTLEDHVLAHPLDEASIDAIAQGLFAGVGWLHRNAVVHRHLKPSNVRLDLTADAGLPRIGDFSLAKTVETRVNVAAGRQRGPKVFGTPQFMSPEQSLDSNKVDHRSDLWSLGCVLYQLCTREIPFDGGSTEEIFDRVRGGAYVPPEALTPDLPRRWADAIRSALVVDPAKRVPTVDQLAERWLADRADVPRQTRRVAPIGKVALAFTDIQGSTRMWEARPEIARNALRSHDAVIRAAMHKHAGYEVKTEGDSFMIAFPTASAAIRFCLDAQRGLHAHPWAPELLELPDSTPVADLRGLRVRMGVHVGRPEVRSDGVRTDYFGPMVNRAARIADAGHGGQILVSIEAWEEARGAVGEDGVARSLGDHLLRGIEREQEIVQVLPRELGGRQFPGLRAKPAG